MKYIMFFIFVIIIVSKILSFIKKILNKISASINKEALLNQTQVSEPDKIKQETPKNFWEQLIGVTTPELKTYYRGNEEPDIIESDEIIEHSEIINKFEKKESKKHVIKKTNLEKIENLKDETNKIPPPSKHKEIIDVAEKKYDKKSKKGNYYIKDLKKAIVWSEIISPPLGLRN